jgi:hypothetical protein
LALTITEMLYRLLFLIAFQSIKEAF